MKLNDSACVIQGSGMSVGTIIAFVKAGDPIRRVVIALGLVPKDYTVERGRWDRVVLKTDAGYQTPRRQNIHVVANGRPYWDSGLTRPFRSQVIERSRILRRRGSVAAASGCVF